jgi:arabinogalactan oligomer/maltooligosaccharide transport system substrate-binding protein
MKSKIFGSALAIGIGLALSGCQPATTPSGLPEEFDFTETQPEVEETQIVTIWAPAAVTSSLQGISGAFEDEYGVVIQFSNVELDQIKSRIDAGNYPDIFFGTHSWTQELAAAGVVAKLSDGALGNTVPDQLKQAFRFEEDLFAVPVSEQHVGLLCNSELVQQQPDFDDLQEFGFGLALDPELGDPYHLYPFMSSFGLSLENLDENNFSADAGFDFAEWLANSEVFDLQSSYQQVVTRFNSGEIGCWLTGPWSLSQIDESIIDSLVVYSVPAAGDNDPVALIDVAGFFVAASSDDPVYANRLVMEYFTRSTSQLAIARSLSGIPAVETSDELLSQFAQTSASALPTPASELIDQLWPVLGATQAELIRNERSSDEVWSEFLQELEVLVRNQN